MGEVIVVTSGKGGVGKSTTTANIGVGLAQLNKKVIVVDTDLGLRNLDCIMGMENRIVYNLVDVIEKTCTLPQAIVEDLRHPGLFLLACAQTKEEDALRPEQMKELAESLAERFDYVIFDCPAGIGAGFFNAIAGADKAIVVCVPEMSSVRDADRVIRLLETAGIKAIHLLINRLRIDLVDEGVMLSAEEIAELLTPPLLGVVPEDTAVSVAAYKGELLQAEDSRAAQAFFHVSQRLTGEDVPFLELREKKRFFRRRKRRQHANNVR